MPNNYFPPYDEEEKDFDIASLLSHFKYDDDLVDQGALDADRYSLVTHKHINSGTFSNSHISITQEQVI
jgi:hypothetical protein